MLGKKESEAFDLRGSTDKFVKKMHEGGSKRRKKGIVKVDYEKQESYVPGKIKVFEEENHVLTQKEELERRNGAEEYDV